jgi:hypothetical protein
MVGDSGTGGTKGLVPAPGTGDAAANKFLKADGTWATTPGGGSGCNTTGSASLVVVDDGAGGCNSVTGAQADANTFAAPRALIFSGTIAPSALGGTTNDYNPANLATASRIEIDPGNSGNTLTGIAGGAAGRTLTLYNSNASSGNLTLANNSGSLSGNRFILPADIVIKPKSSREFVWSTSANGWVEKGAGLANTGVSGSICTNCNLSYGPDGRITAASNGAGGSGYAALQFTTGSTTLSATNVYFGMIGNSGTTNTRAVPAPYNMTVDNLYCTLQTAPGAGITYAFTLNLNGSDNTNQQVTGTNASDYSSGTNTPVSVTRGQRLLIHLSSFSGTPSAAATCTIRTQAS